MICWAIQCCKTAAQQALRTVEGSMDFDCFVDKFENSLVLILPIVGSTSPPAKHVKMYPREICLFRRVDNLVEAQLAEHEPPKLAGWTRFPIGSYRRPKCGAFDLSRLMLSVDIWVQGASNGRGYYRPLVAIQKKCKSENNETERFFYFAGCTIIPGFPTFNLRFIDLPDMFSIRSSVKHG